MAQVDYNLMEDHALLREGLTGYIMADVFRALGDKAIEGAWIKLTFKLWMDEVKNINQSEIKRLLEAAGAARVVLEIERVRRENSRDEEMKGVHQDSETEKEAYQKHADNYNATLKPHRDLVAMATEIQNAAASIKTVRAEETEWNEQARLLTTRHQGVVEDAAEIMKAAKALEEEGKTLAEDPHLKDKISARDKLNKLMAYWEDDPLIPSVTTIDVESYLNTLPGKTANRHKNMTTTDIYLRSIVKIETKGIKVLDDLSKSYSENVIPFSKAAVSK